MFLRPSRVIIQLCWSNLKKNEMYDVFCTELPGQLRGPACLRGQLMVWSLGSKLTPPLFYCRAGERRMLRRVVNLPILPC